MKTNRWHTHPAVRSEKTELTMGERAADAMRNGMGSWLFVFGALCFLGIWMFVNRSSGGLWDPYPFILLNLALSCLAALQGAILLIAAKRQDQIASELAQHDFDTDVRSKELLEQLSLDFLALSQQHAELQRLLLSCNCRRDIIK
jgi:uncharacterized membrane protein